MGLIGKFPERIELFIKAANQYHLKMILVGGGAVKFHGYQRHSSDLDFWVDNQEENLKNQNPTYFLYRFYEQSVFSIINFSQFILICHKN